MYSNKKNVLQLIALLKAYEIKHVVLCPGSRNAPVTQSLANDPFFTCHSVVDERSAGFYALGIIQRNYEPAAVCCTSGSALLNLAPAVAEAHYQKLPLVVISADRPEAWIDQGVGQTLPQPGVFRSLVNKSVQLPEIRTKEDEWFCNRLINEALLKTDQPEYGPVHINIPISEPLFEFTETELPDVRVIKRHYSLTIGLDIGFIELANRFTQYSKRMILVGQMIMGDDLGLFINDIIERHDCIILREYLSNMPPGWFIKNFDAVLYALPKTKWKEYAPELLITMGGQVMSKRIKELFRMHPPKEHWHISLSGEVMDTYQCLTDIIETDETEFITQLKELPRSYGNRANGFAFKWMDAAHSLPYPKVGFSDLYAVNELMSVIPENGVLHLANSSSVRLAQLCKLKVEYLHILSNRGTNGIDGCVSTAVGYSAVCQYETVFLITGDLAFFYDINGLWNRQISSKLRIMLNNNGGGEIFYTLPKLEQSEALDKYISASHDTSAKAWAETMGFLYLPVTDEKEMQEHLPTFIGESDKPILMEVFTSKEENVKILREYYQSLKIKQNKYGY